jgi:ABC-type glycerol-3-phosphate transport system substrate-binding protein
MKKFVLFVAMFAVCTFALAACGSKKAEEATLAEEAIEVTSNATTQQPLVTTEATEISK